MAGSALLRSLYLDPAAAGVGWLLDPDSPAAGAGLFDASRRAATDPCDPSGMAADLDDLLVLLRERHLGLATGRVSDEGLTGWADEWRMRLDTERPGTWGTALGTDLYRLRRLVGDNHLRAGGEDPELLRAANARDTEPTHGREPGPIVEDYVHDGVLCLRIRQCDGPSIEAEQLMADFEAAHDRFFNYDKIVVDVRSNPGGSDEFAWNWITRRAARSVSYPPDGCWKIDGKRLAVWNQIVEHAAVAGPDQVPPGLAAQRPTPHPDAELRLETEVETIPPADQPWHGQMLVLTDRGTASAGESVAWMFRQAFDAKLLGGRTGGVLTFGDLAPYILPRSGLQLELATHSFGWTGVEMVGLPVDLELDPRTPLAQTAAGFDRLYSRAGHDAALKGPEREGM